MTDSSVFNPYENRNVQNPITNCGAFVTLLKSVVGTGIHALPLAFKYAGIVNGIFSLMLVTFLLIHGIQLLIYSMVECARRMQVGYANYPQAMVYSFAQGPKCFKYCSRAAGYIADAVLAFTHYGICVVYLVFVAANFKQVVDYHVNVYDVDIYLVFVGLFSVPIFLIQSLKWLVPFNLMASILIYAGFTVMFHYMATGLPSLTERHIIFGDLKNMGLFFGIVLFSVSSVGVMLAVEAEMARPQEYLGWFGILDITIFVVMISYSLFGFFGYWRYGDEVASSVSLNLPTNEPGSQAAKLLIAMAVFLSYPLCGFVVIDIIMTHYWNRTGNLKHAKLKETLVRIMFVLLSTLNSILFPNFGLLLTDGAFSISLLNLIFPALIEICLYYPPEYSYGRFKWMLVKDMFLIIVGTIILVQGIVVAILALVRASGRGK